MTSANPGGPTNKAQVPDNKKKDKRIRMITDKRHLPRVTRKDREKNAGGASRAFSSGRTITDVSSVRVGQNYEKDNISNRGG